MFHTSQPPNKNAHPSFVGIGSDDRPRNSDLAVVPWGEQPNAFVGGLPSWIAPAPDDEPSQRPSVPSVPISDHTRVSVFPSAPPSVPPPSARLHPATIPPPIRDYEGEIVALQTQLESCLRTMTRMRRRVLESSERQLVELATAIAEQVVGRELQTDPSFVVRVSSSARVAIP